MTHEPLCPQQGEDDWPSCPICDLLKAARNDERAKYQETWRANLPRIEARNWLEGYRAATNRRNIPEWVREGTTTLRRG